MTIGSLCFGHWKKFYIILYHLGVSENSENPIVPNGFADHEIPMKWLFHWEYTQHFQTNPSSYHSWYEHPKLRVHPWLGTHEKPFHAVQVSADRSFQLIDPEPIAPKEHFPTGRLEQDGDVASIKTRAGSA